MRGRVGRAVCQVVRRLKRQGVGRARGRGARQRPAAFRRGLLLGGLPVRPGKGR